jgi:hypothetical protein
MAFPQTVQDIKTELYLNAAWTDITSKVRSDPGVTIVRGRSDETRRAEPSSCSLALNNTDGRFSPRNPTGIYYGQIGRNTPIRVSILSDKSWLPIDADTGTVATINATTPDTGVLDFAGDLDLRFEADLDSWYDPMELVTKWTETGNQRSYHFAVTTGGYLFVATSVDGVAVTTAPTSTMPLPTLYGRQAVRATFDANNGAGGNTTTYYYSSSLTGTWVQLGDPVITAGVTTVFNSTALLAVGTTQDAADLSTPVVTRGKIYGAQAYDGIAGTLRANPDFSIQAEGATSFVDSVSRTWTINGASLTKRDYRFRGEVSSWPQEWDQSGSDVYANIQAAGILRRLGQGQSPVPSAMRKTVSADGDVVAYWPAEDGANSEALASAFSGHPAMQISGTPALADYSDWAASGDLPMLNLASLVGVVPSYTSTDSVQVRFFLNIPSGGMTNGTIIASLKTTGTARRWDLVYGTGGTLALNAYDEDDVSILAGGAAAFLMNGRPCYVIIRLIDNGTGIDYSLGIIDIDDGLATNVGAVTLAARQMGRAVRVTINPGKTMNDVVVGQISVHTDSSYVEATLVSTILAWAGETAGSRIKRLCAENEIEFFQIASIDNTERMGQQGVKTAIELIQECADTDMGILYEPRDNYGLAYRPRKTLNNQPAAVTASYSTNQLTSFRPVDDDQNTTNDVTVNRIGGSSYRATDTTSALSTQQPPLGVGIYDDAPSISLYLDSRLADQAGWRLHLGTVDEARFPVIGFNLTSPSFLATSSLTFDVLSLDVGDRLVITGSPSWLPPDDVQQIAQGFTEYLSNFERTIDVNCSPASPWYIGRYASVTTSGAGQDKYSSDGSTVNTIMNTSTTTMSVATAAGSSLWTTAAAEMPIDIIVAGERMSVTAISSTTSPQSFTVTRSVNGIVKTHAVGEKVVLFRPARYAL